MYPGPVEQRLFDENDLPEPAAKLELYRTGKQILTDKGYTDIGTDHFALTGEALWLARQNGTLHRNFMGYSIRNTALLWALAYRQSVIPAVHSHKTGNRFTITTKC
jgi:oxygen-independent coproporphyrinogen-3 oxidase